MTYLIRARFGISEYDWGAFELIYINIKYILRKSIGFAETIFSWINNE